MNYLMAKTFKKAGSVAIPLAAVSDFLAYSEELQATYKRKIEVLVISAPDEEELDTAWPEHAPVLMAADKAAFERAISEKTAPAPKGGKKR